ncbi:DUF3817 domain-containing protein [Corynebacterium aquilae]|uniref:Membrane protein n=1 Tax=Corynebacterium aquilae DSM 44791 TaxID=1431546 RepID=A0A1L7CHQ8_9CORY|nr:DUF3817 domain-containing protein [Corynebacterium aquilae]APT85345.1 membrane protein [Corynebacterium aquilae DSM 44791]
MSTPTVTPARQKRVADALKLFRIAAWVTGVWLLVLTGRLILDYGFKMDLPQWAFYIGQVHGLFYVLYLAATVNLGTKARWEPTKWILTALAGTIPFLSFWAEHVRTKEVKAAFQLP